jgi:hypothetical protein
VVILSASLCVHFVSATSAVKNKRGCLTTLSDNIFTLSKTWKLSDDLKNARRFDRSFDRKIRKEIHAENAKKMSILK